jgi:hypothetical protein
MVVVCVTVVVVVIVVTLTGPTTSSGSTRGGRGIWLKLKEFIMSFAAATLGAVGEMENTVSASLIMEANSYVVLSM